jgi:hypothetical protein
VQPVVMRISSSDKTIKNNLLNDFVLENHENFIKSD